MIGGWESFHGRMGEYHRTPLAEVLPVRMLDRDDRRTAQPCLVRKLADHPIVEGLPWDAPPGIGGFNAILGRPGSQTLLSAVPFTVRCCRGSFEFTGGEEAPLLVVGQQGRGRTAALATDAAPIGSAGSSTGATVGCSKKSAADSSRLVTTMRSSSATSCSGRCSDLTMREGIFPCSKATRSSVKAVVRRVSSTPVLQASSKSVCGRAR